jgi:hypothetical protein
VALRTERTRLLAERLAAMPPDKAGELLAALPSLESLADALTPLRTTSTENS